MTRWAIRAVGIAALAIAAIVIGASTGSATGTGQDFGQHVRTCAQTEGFDATHNPGMHTGFAGWDPTHVC